MGLALGDALAVEVGHLLDQIEVLEQDGTVGTDGERVLLTGDGDAGVGGSGWSLSWPGLAIRAIGIRGLRGISPLISPP